MKKLLFLPVVLLLIIITGCSSIKVVKNNYIFKGENDQWAAEYQVSYKGTFVTKDDFTKYDSQGETTLRVTYKNDISDLPPVKQFSISYERDGAKGTIIDAHGDIPLQKSYVHKSSAHPLVIYDEIIKVTIMLDGNAQTIELKKTL